MDLLKKYNVHEIVTDIKGVVTHYSSFSAEIMLMDYTGILCIAEVTHDNQKIFDFHFIGGSYSCLSLYEECIENCYHTYLEERVKNEKI